MGYQLSLTKPALNRLDTRPIRKHPGSQQPVLPQLPALLTFGEHRGLACELLQHLGCPGQSVSTLPYADVEAELADAKFPHGVLLFTLILLQRKRSSQHTTHASSDSSIWRHNINPFLLIPIPNESPKG